MDNRAKTIFCDVDGTLIKHYPPTVTTMPDHTSIALEGTIEKLLEWDKKGYNIVLVSGRRESSREITTKQLQQLGIIYDKLILGIGGGERILINDRKPNSDKNYATAINLKRDCGIRNINL
jgi:hypothetical protein